MTPTPMLFDPITIGDVDVRNRITMGSMTRNRCTDSGRPTASSVEHYATRARDGVGLIITEGVFISLHGAEWPHAPVMYDESHVLAWKEVTDAVHREGGKIFFQPWHPGRIQHEEMPLLKETGYPVLAPSRIQAAGGKFRTIQGVPGHTSNITPIADPKAVVEQFRHSVALAKRAGFDGIELLSQGGYLLHNFLCSHANARTDDYGGSAANRCRFPLEVLDAIIGVWGARKVGVKLCPTDDYNDSATSYAELKETYTTYVGELMKRNLAFINISRRGCKLGRQQDAYFAEKPRPLGKELPENYEPLVEFGPMVKKAGSATLLMVNHEYTVEEASDLLAHGRIDLVTFARPFIYNPDLVTRIRNAIPFATNTRGGGQSELRAVRNRRRVLQRLARCESLVT